MPSVTKYPQRVIQEGSTVAKINWKEVANLKTNNNNYASTDLMAKDAKPKRLELTGFNFNLPEGAEVTKIMIKYSYRKRAKVKDKYPSIAGPTIALKSSGLANDLPYVNDGVAPQKDFPSSNWTRSWTGTKTVEAITGVKGTSTGGSQIEGNTETPVNSGLVTYETQKTKTVSYNYKLPSRATVNNTNFGIAFQFPKNTSSNEGYIDFKTIEMTITYKVPSYGLKLAASGNNGEFVRDVPFRLVAQVTNKQLIDYVPTLHITVPQGTSLTITNITLGSFKKLSDTVYEWKPKFTSEVGDITLELETRILLTGTQTIELRELYNNTSTTINIDVIAQATPIDPTADATVEQILYAIEDTDFTIPLKIPSSMKDTQFYLYSEQELDLYIEGSYVTVNAGEFYTIPMRLFDDDGIFNVTAKTGYLGVFTLGLDDSQTIPDVATFIVKVVPLGFDVPRLSIIKLSEEETHRLGNGYNYVVSSDMRIVCQTSSIPVFQDYYRNFRIGVVNNIPDTLNLTRIFNACNDWSNGISVFNDFENIETDFVYNEDYPVYIIITGNYDNTVCNAFELEFSRIELIEDDREDKEDVIFPIPIRDITLDTEDSIAELNIPLNTHCNNLIFYDFNFEDAFTNKNNLSIRGIGVRVNASCDYSTTLSAKLISPTGETSERSIITDVTNQEHILGGSSDRWGFNISDLNNLDKFRLEIRFDNNNNENLSLDIKYVELVVFYSFYEQNIVDMFIEGENMAALNLFLDEVEIPEGLETNTKYLNVDGTDTNKAYRQNIKEKKIKVKFSIDECNIDNAIATLQDISETLLTERDKLYRPIPKRVEFSHYPGIYWEYILEDAIDAEVEGGSNFDCTVELMIPSGTAYTNDEITTGKAGRVTGLAKINPVILLTPTDEHIEIEDTLTEQKFLMTYNAWSSEDNVEIDCNNRTITLFKSDGTTEDISVYADVNTDWFLLYGEFLLEETGCVIQSVTWTERK